MAEPQPPNVVEGATAGDVEDEVTSQQAKSAEDRKAAAAMSRLDANDDDANSAQVDQDAVNQAMKSLGGGGAAAKTEVKKVKVEAADVTLLVDQLDLPKAKATELLKAHDGDAVQAMRAFISAP